MKESCELFRIIPREKINEVFRTSKTVTADCDYTFLAFEEVYKAVTMFVPKGKVIIDLGCAYAFQSWYFRDYKKYIGVDCCTKPEDVLKTENSEFYFMSIQDFCRKVLPNIGYCIDDIFAICSYVPDDNARETVRKYFKHCLVYYP